MLVNRPWSVIYSIGFALGFAVVALVGWGLTGNTWPLLLALVLLLGAVAWAEVRGAAWRHAAELPAGPPARARVLDTVAVPPAREPGPGMVAAEGLDAAEVEPLGQDDYAALLDSDRVVRQRFQLVPGFEPENLGFVMQRPRPWECCACHSRAVLLSISHPIWDGPFHGAGSGRCDVREILVCPHCDRVDRALEQTLGLWPPLVHLLVPTMTEILTHGTATGRPIRLPWLNTLPIRLREELYERPAFHNLMLRVERAGPPSPPAPSRQPHVYVVYDQDEARHEPSAARPEQPCEVCEQPYQAPLHIHAFEEGTTGAAGPAACRRCGLAAWNPIHGGAAAGGGRST